MLFFTLFLLIQTVQSQRFRISLLKASLKSPPPRAQASFTSFDDFAILFGGLGSHGALDDTWIYHGVNNTWEEVIVSTKPNPRYSFVSAVLKPGNEDRYYLAISGGRNKTHILQKSLVWTFDLQHRVWAPVSLFPFQESPMEYKVLSRANACGGGFRERAMVVSHGRNDDEVFSDTHEIAFAGPKIAVIRPLHGSSSFLNIGSPPALYNASCLVTDANELIVYGGCYVAGYCPSNDAWAFNMGNRRWRKLGNGGTPRLNGAMAQGLSTFQDIGVSPKHSVVIWGGHAHPLRDEFPAYHGDVAYDIGYINTKSDEWVHERIMTTPGTQTIKNRIGTSLIPIRIGGESDTRHYVIFGGQYDTARGGFAIEALLLSFTPSNAILAFKSKVGRTVSNLFTHALLMFFSYGIMIPVGITVGRFLKHCCKDRRVWFILHWTTQAAGLVLAWAGFMFGIYKESTEVNATHAHGIVGYLLMALLSLETVASLPWVRPNPDSGQYRSIWCFFHNCGGFIIVVGGGVNILFGLFLLLVSPDLLLAWVIAFTVIVISNMVLEALRMRSKSHLPNYKRFEVDSEKIASMAHQ